jgi:hypothetical protein
MFGGINDSSARGARSIASSIAVSSRITATGLPGRTIVLVNPRASSRGAWQHESIFIDELAMFAMAWQELSAAGAGCMTRQRMTVDHARAIAKIAMTAERIAGRVM